MVIGILVCHSSAGHRILESLKDSKKGSYHSLYTQSSALFSLLAVFWWPHYQINIKNSSFDTATYTPRSTVASLSSNKQRQQQVETVQVSWHQRPLPNRMLLSMSRTLIGRSKSHSCEELYILFLADTEKYVRLSVCVCVCVSRR